jgi:putative nucleotidyltransferase with HDIG domain
MKKELVHIMKCIETLPPVSPHTLRIMQLAANPRFNIRDLTALVTLDLTLAATCLKLVNSACFGLRNPVVSIEKAVVYLGSRGILDLAASGGLSGVMGAPLEGYCGETGDLWAHSLRTAIASVHASALLLPGEPADAVYTAGLLHDIGKAVLSGFLSEHSGTLREYMVGNQSSDFATLEKTLLSLDHAEAGALLAEKWKLPESIGAVIRYHHTPGMAPEPYRNLCLAVHIGDILAMLGGCGTGCDTLSYRLDPLAEEILTLHGNRLEKMMLDIDGEFTRAQERMRTASGEKDD